MRITGGQAKGRLLVPPKGMAIRPTTDKTREAIFNIIGHDLSGLKVLDLFAGTGSLGIEALSRNAKHCIFIDFSLQSIKLVKKNLAICGYQSLGTILRKDLKKGLPLSHPQLQQRFDLIFLDPPYGKNLIMPLLEHLSSTNVLSNGCRVVAELSKKEKFTVSSIGDLQSADTRIYGDTMIIIYAFGRTR